MKRLHRPDLYGWSKFNEDRNIDLHSVLWVRGTGDVAIDPLPMCAHDAAHLHELGPVAAIAITNSNHVRDAQGLAEKSGAELMGPAQECNGLHEVLVPP